MSRLFAYIDEMSRGEVWCWCGVLVLAFWVAVAAMFVWWPA